MLQLHLAGDEQHGENRHEKHRLKLEAERQGNKNHGPYRLAVQRQNNAHHRQGHIDAVALAPDSAV